MGFCISAFRRKIKRLWRAEVYPDRGLIIDTAGRIILAGFSAEYDILEKIHDDWKQKGVDV